MLLSEEKYEALKRLIPYVVRKGGEFIKTFKDNAWKEAKVKLATLGIYPCNSNHRNLARVLDELLYVTAEQGFFKYSINRLSQKFEVTRQTISNIIKKLEAAGIITKITSLKGTKKDKTIFVNNLHPCYSQIMQSINSQTDFTSELASELPTRLSLELTPPKSDKASNGAGSEPKKVPSYTSYVSYSSKKKEVETYQSLKNLTLSVTERAMNWLNSPSQCR